jgi:hypothetical protein
VEAPRLVDPREVAQADPAARAGLLAARDRMLRFYAGTTGWRRAFDHNHLRITWSKARRQPVVPA